MKSGYPYGSRGGGRLPSRFTGNNRNSNMTSLTSEEIPLTAMRTWSGDTSTDQEGSPRHYPYQPLRDSPTMRSPYPGGSPIHQRIRGGHQPSPLASPGRTNNANHIQYRLVGLLIGGL